MVDKTDDWQELRCLSIHEVVQMVGMSRPTIYRRIRAGEFPSPVRISNRRVAWRVLDIGNHLASLRYVWEQEGG